MYVSVGVPGGGATPSARAVSEQRGAGPERGSPLPPNIGDDVVDLTGELIRIDSSNPFRTTERCDGSWQIDGNEEGMVELLEPRLKALGLKTRRQSCGNGQSNLLAEKGSGSRALLLYGHMDTVEVKAGWTREEALCPRLAERKVNGRNEQVLYGLGSNDMKGGLAAILIALQGFEPRGYRIKVAFGVDEEHWSLGSHVLVREGGFLDDVCAALVPEVGDSEGEHLGPGSLTVGRRGRIEWEVEVPGVAAHGSFAGSRQVFNAVAAAARIALALEDPGLELPSYSHSEDIPAICAGQFVSRIEGGQGTLSIPDRATLIVDRSMVPGEDPATATHRLRDHLEGLWREGVLWPGVEEGSRPGPPLVKQRFRPTPYLKPYVVPDGHPFLEYVESTVRGIVGRTERQIGLSVADENRLGGEAGIPVIVVGPHGEECHAPWEWVSVSSLHRLVEVYRELIEGLPAKVLR